ncbi:MAG: EAL domain-containing protein [Kutzneria sp.]|nr:EAL domain-containing protein [Kutzneria sp.]
MTHPDTMMEKGLRSLVSIVRSAGVAVTVCGIANRHQARWWRRIGCDIALGRFFGPASPLDEVIDDGQASIRIPSQERKSP